MGGGEGAGRPGTLRARRFFWRVARLRGVTLRSLPAGGGGGGGGPGTHGRGLREAGEARPRPRPRGPRSFGRSVTGFPKRTRRALGSKAPIGLSENHPFGRNLGAELLGLKKERGSRKGGEGGGGGGGEQSLEARRRSSTAEAAASASRRRRRALACRGPDLVWGARAFLFAVGRQTLGKL